MDMNVPKYVLISVEVVKDDNDGIAIEITDEAGEFFRICGINSDGVFWMNKVELESVGLSY